MMYQERLKRLRHLMTKARIDYYYVPSADAHRNEYVPDCWQRRAWITGFTGSAGDALIGKKQAYLWTDSRYFLQAEQELHSDFQLMKQQPGTPSIDQWLATQGTSLRIGIDPQLITIQQQQTWHATLENTQSELVWIEDNWIDTLWDEQPALPSSPMISLAMQYTGCATKDKLAELRNALKNHHADAMVITRLDAIAWLFNIRGNDIRYNPLVISYALLTQDKATLFINPNCLLDHELDYYQAQQISLAHYHDFKKALNNLNCSVLLDPNSTSQWTFSQLKKAHIICTHSPITLKKAIKNTTEQKGMREAHRIDAIAMIKFLHWISTHWQQGITEISAAQQLETFRREDARCQDLSFTTISGFASNGAIIHYVPQESTNKTIDDSALYLVDSGGQYFEGTTDVTRTIHLGTPSADERAHYTRVLKGHLALRHSQFPPGTCGEQLDGLARQPLWDAELDYAHGTGHGVGCYLCVHEGPQMISPRPTHIALQPGMVVSNEPGVYIKNHYGIRIENVCLIYRQHNRPSSFLTFEDLTLIPYAQNLIDITLLSSKEIKWIDHYHEQIYQRISPDLSPNVSRWLQKATKPLRSTR